MKSTKVRNLVLFAAVLFAGVIIAKCTFLRTQVARVELGPGRECEMDVYPYYMGRGEISYFENGKRVGGVILTNGLLYDPEAIFPCPNGHGVVCLSWPDTEYAAFTIDFSHRNTNTLDLYDRLKGTVYDSSDFRVRACTPGEVEFVRHFIESADPKTFAACTRWGEGARDEESRQGLLNFLRFATVGAKDADPLVTPTEYIEEDYAR